MVVVAFFNQTGFFPVKFPIGVDSVAQHQPHLNMMPELPTRFPCWCRATYSWGGETKRDLGFVEGDLIECLNAGDGSWWMGRLRRDRRAVGLFPSNFVQVLDDSFRPMSRVSSPMPGSNTGSLSRNSNANTSPQKTKTFRKPFQAYAKATSPSPSATPVVKALSRGPSPSPNALVSYSHSPRIASPSGYNSGYNSGHVSRGPSPMPTMSHQQIPPDPYSNPQGIESSPPPPAPPPHRIPYATPATTETHSPMPHMNDRYNTISRGPSPIPPSPGAPGYTPSPLRDAIDDVMSSLHDMSIRQDAPSPSPAGRQISTDPWSPEAFSELQQKPYDRKQRRPRSSLGIGRDEEEYHVDSGYHSQQGIPRDFDDGGSHLYLNNDEESGEVVLESSQDDMSRTPDELFLPTNGLGPPPAPIRKDSHYQPRANSSLSTRVFDNESGDLNREVRLRNRKSAYELGRKTLDRTFTTKSSATNSSIGVQSTTTQSSTSTQRTHQSIMSGYSASGISATSAGSLARRNELVRFQDQPMGVASGQGSFHPYLGGTTMRPQTPLKDMVNMLNHESRPRSTLPGEISTGGIDSGGPLGGFTSPKPRKSGFFKKLVGSAKTSAASVRSSIAASQGESPRSPVKKIFPNGSSAIAGGSAAREGGISADKSGTEWVQVRRDVNRSNSLSRNERVDRIERCQMMNYPVMAPVDALFETAEGDEGADGLPIEDPVNLQIVNLQLVDKSARFINSLPPMTNPTSLAQGYVCRPYRSDVQRLRAIFIWVSEKVGWEEDFEGEADSRRVIQMRRGCAKEVAVLVMEMCAAVGIHAEVVRGYLKAPGEFLDREGNQRPNHWWNAVIVDNGWRIMDCSLASPTNPKRGQYSSAGPQVAESGWFLARPMEICYTHIPSIPEQQHICPPIAPEILLALPCACPPYFRLGIQMVDYDTSLCQLENLEFAHVQFTAPSDIEVFAEVEVSAYARDVDGDVFESGDTITVRALAQAEWVTTVPAGGGGSTEQQKKQKRFTIKAFLPGDSNAGVLKIYAGTRGLMHSIRDNPHPLTFVLPITHRGGGINNNPPYEFFVRHPTPHALRHDLYLAQPQCARLAVNNTFVFAVRQHPSSSFSSSGGAGGGGSCASTSSTTPTAATPSVSSSSSASLAFSPRPSSALSMISSTASSTVDYFSFQGASTASLSTTPSASASASNGGSGSGSSQQSKPAKLAIQSPSGKIMRLMRKPDSSSNAENGGAGTGGNGGGGGGIGGGGGSGVWETIIKVGERGTWRGLVLADRSARWCVWGEWECV